MGVIRQGFSYSVKDVPYPVQLLLSDHIDATTYEGSVFFNLYLSPADYHRVHMPLTAR